MSDADQVVWPAQEDSSPPERSLPQPAVGRRTGQTDRIQILLVILFVAAFFASAAMNKFELISFGDIGSVVFLGLAASVTLYYFLESVAEVHAKTYSLTGAGALFVIVIGVGWGMHLQGSGAQLREMGLLVEEKDTTIKELRDSLALAVPDRVVEGQVRTVGGQAVNGEAHNLAVGVLIDGVFFSGRDGDHHFRVTSLPPRADYTLLVYDLFSKQAVKTTHFAPEAVERPNASVPINAVIPESFVPR